MYFDLEAPIVAFLDLIELDGHDAETNENALWLSLRKVVISKLLALNN